ncbi:hypothetical protein OG21DRAFT_1604811 [Imleria badia]|nr:hypothetical protein OG21DRAFT_1604811 [Imleria badia]
MTHHHVCRAALRFEFPIPNDIDTALPMLVWHEGLEGQANKTKLEMVEGTAESTREGESSMSEACSMLCGATLQRRTPWARPAMALNSSPSQTVSNWRALLPIFGLLLVISRSLPLPIVTVARTRIDPPSHTSATPRRLSNARPCTVGLLTEETVHYPINGALADLKWASLVPRTRAPRFRLGRRDVRRDRVPHPPLPRSDPQLAVALVVWRERDVKRPKGGITSTTVSTTSDRWRSVPPTRG